MCLEMLYISAGLVLIQLHVTQARILSLLYTCERSEAVVHLEGDGPPCLGFFWRHTCHVANRVKERWRWLDKLGPCNGKCDGWKNNVAREKKIKSQPHTLTLSSLSLRSFVSLTQARTHKHISITERHDSRSV